MNGQHTTGPKPSIAGSSPAPAGTGVQGLAVTLYGADHASLRPMTPEERQLLGLPVDGPGAALVIVRGGGWSEVHDSTRVWASVADGSGPARYSPLPADPPPSPDGSPARLADAIRPRALGVYAGEQVTRRPATAAQARELRVAEGAQLYLIVRAHGALEYHPTAGLRLVATTAAAPAYYLNLSPAVAL